MSAGEAATERPPTGLIIGRFDPPHLGHSFLVEQAAAQCERLVVYVNSSSARDAAPGSLRAGWLAELHPDVIVVEVVHDLPTDWDDEDLWRRWIELFRGHWPHEAGPDIVFSSDPYVAELARRLGAEPVVVDADRVNVPISATMVRNDPAAHLGMLAPPVRAWVEANWM
jgi:HTH-type transcriptional regulator, transcriptional repressor of NAD biosynthesis genes